MTRKKIFLFTFAVFALYAGAIAVADLSAQPDPQISL
jgi:hypothetical protein